VGSGLAAQGGDNTIDEAAVKLSRRCSARELSRFKAAGEDGETGQNREAVAREKSGGCCGEMEVRYGGDGGGWQQQAMAAGCMMFPGRRREGEKIKREELGRLGQKWATRGIGLGHIEEMAIEFEERMGCSRKTNGPIKVEDFSLDSKVVLFSFKNFFR
jgi:hypothetical protein